MIFMENFEKLCLKYLIINFSQNFREFRGKKKLTCIHSARVQSVFTLPAGLLSFLLVKTKIW